MTDPEWNNFVNITRKLIEATERPISSVKKEKPPQPIDKFKRVVRIIEKLKDDVEITIQAYRDMDKRVTALEKRHKKKTVKKKVKKKVSKKRKK